MGRREQARAEAAFLRGETGVDGQATEEKRDEAQVELDKAREQLLRGGTFLGRELLTWLLWRSESGDPITELEGEDLTVFFFGRVVLRGVGEVSELVARGALAPYSEQVRRALDRGLLLHVARLRLTHGEKVYEVTLDAEHLDVRSAKLPALMSEEEDDRLSERLYLAGRLSSLVDALVQSFLEVRASRGWSKQVVPELKRWMRGAEVAAEEEASLTTARRSSARRRP